MFKMSLAHSFIEISNTVSYIIARKNKLMWNSYFTLLLLNFLLLRVSIFQV
jgi:hypothetical protein